MIENINAAPLTQVINKNIYSFYFPIDCLSFDRHVSNVDLKDGAQPITVGLLEAPGDGMALF